MMGFGKRLKGFIKHGSFNLYENLVQSILKEQDVREEVAQYLPLLSAEEKELLVDQVWDKASSSTQEILVLEVYGQNHEKLMDDFKGLKESKQIQILEILSFISRQEVSSFLVEKMQSKKESISLTATAAVKRQKTIYTLGPMLMALTQPDQWLPTRVIEVLREMDKKVLTKQLIKMSREHPSIHQTLVEILGEIGDQDCLPLLAELANSPEESLRKTVIEALKELKIKESSAIVVKFLNDDKWQIRMLAAQTLFLLKEPLALPFLQERLALENDKLVKELIEEAIENCIEENIENNVAKESENNEDDSPLIVDWVRER